mgnify:CR=1 FL=1
MTIKYLDSKRVSALSTDTKPTNLEDNSILVEKDTGDRYWHDASIVPSTVTFEDDFSSDNWTDACPTNIGVAGGVMHAIGARDNTNDTSYIDLGTPLSDTAWVMRFKANMTTATAGGSGSSNIIYLALSDSSGARSVSQDSINFGWELWSAGNTIGIVSNEAAAQDYISSGTSIAANAVRLDYFEVIRNSATLVTVNQYSDSAYSTLVNSITRAVTAATGGLRYLKCNNLDDSSTEDSDVVVDIDDIKIYNGITSVVGSSWTLET